MLSLQFKVLYFTIYMGFPGGSDCKESTCNAGEPDLIGRCPGEADGYPLQYSYLENPRDKIAYQAAVHGIAKSWI